VDEMEDRGSGCGSDRGNGILRVDVAVWTSPKDASKGEIQTFEDPVNPFGPSNEEDDVKLASIRLQPFFTCDIV